MNKILNEIKIIIKENISKYLPEVKTSDLEGNGEIYYMNGDNGTEFEWYVNEHLPYFMVFYNDEQNLGALKLSVYNDGGILLYIYGDKGNKFIKEIKTSIDVTKDEIFKLAVMLKYEADDCKIWDASIDTIKTDGKIIDEKIVKFKEAEEHLKPIKNKMKLFNKTACVSNKILEEGWKVGYMYREELSNETDSGWNFMAGNEDEDYTSNYNNFKILSLYEVYELDKNIWDYIDSPIGTKFIRISSNEFEIDKNNKEIYMEKR